MDYRTPFVNQNGIAILDSTSVSVGTEAVAFTLNEPLRLSVEVASELPEIWTLSNCCRKYDY